MDVWIHVSMYGYHVWIKRLSAEELMPSNCGAGEDSWQSLNSMELKPVSPKGNHIYWNFHWKDWCWHWSCNTLATWCEELTHWKGPWCWERLKAGGDGDDRGWDGWMAPLTWGTWVWASSGSWWWTGKPGMLQSMGSQRIGLWKLKTAILKNYKLQEFK